MKKNKPSIRTDRAVKVFNEMLGLRRIYCQDTNFFKSIEVWDWIADSDAKIRIKEFDGDRSGNEKKAGVVAFDDRFTLIAPSALLSNARNGCKFSNFTLAHEFSHIALDHHAKGAVVKNFQLYSSQSGLANIPPNDEELEANYAATMFLCGIALLAPNVDPVRLADRACCDVYYTKKTIKLCQTSVFREAFKESRKGIKRVVL